MLSFEHHLQPTNQLKFKRSQGRVLHFADYRRVARRGVHLERQCEEVVWCGG